MIWSAWFTFLAAILLVLVVVLTLQLIGARKTTRRSDASMAERRRRARAKLSVVGQCPPHLPMPDPDSTDGVICAHCRQPIE